MNWLKKIFGGEKKEEKELFPSLTLEEKRKVLDLNEIFFQSILARRKGKAMVLNIDMNVDFVTKMSDDDILEAIELSRLSQKAIRATRPKEALRLFEQIVAKAPFDSISMMSIGVLHARLGNKQKAFSYLEKALASDPHNQRIQENLKGVRQYFGMPL